MLRPRFFFPFAAAAALAAALFAGCSNQGEGERCDHLNNNADGTNDDCQSGLVCLQGSTLNGTPNGDRCCPQNRAQATTSVCQTPSTAFEAGVPPDTGTVVDASGNDAADGSTPVDGNTPVDANGTDAADAGTG